MPPRTPKPLPEPVKRRSPGTGSVTARSDGRIAVLLPKELDPARRVRYGPGRRRRWASVGEATLWLDAEVARLRAPAQTASPDETLGSYLARWYALNEHEWPERTRSAYRAGLRRWAMIGGVRLGELTREVVQGGVAELRRMTWRHHRRDGTPTDAPRPYGVRTIAQAVSVLHQALDDLIPDVMSYNPARGRRRGRGTPAPEQPVWSAEQAARFLEVAERHEPRVALAFRLILRRALRTGEAVDLTIADVDEAGGTLRVDETPGLVRGTSGPTKTRRVREVPLSADLVARIKAHRRAYPATDPHLFLIDGERISLSYFRRLWHRVVRLARLPAITPKDGRATCATVLLDEGRPLPEVSRLLGHASVATTARFYQRTIARRRDEIEKIGEQMDAALNRAQSTESRDESAR